ncbi:MAG: rhodanese-like domain-containing protein [Methanoregula sp.]|nr:rhodanese-like domain-containing protein [Methanoregula sp.]
MDTINVSGYPAGGFSQWTKAAQEISTLPSCSVQQLNERLRIESPFLLYVRDIRNRDPVGHIQNAHQRYVGEILFHLDEIPGDKPLVIYCDAGYKGSLAASIPALHNYRDMTNVPGGITAWKRAGFTIEK